MHAVTDPRPVMPPVTPAFVPRNSYASPWTDNAAGAMFVPMTLKRLGFDPAQADGMVPTTLTDVMGFLGFLGLATLVPLR